MYDFDKDLVREIVNQIYDAVCTIATRTKGVESASFFTDSPDGMEKLDGVCMLFIAIGESLKNVDKITNKTLLANHSEIDWAGIKGFRDIMAHHYFDVDAEQVFWICSKQLLPLEKALKKIIQDLG